MRDFYERFWRPSLYVLNEAERNGIYLDADICATGAKRAAHDLIPLEGKLRSWGSDYTRQLDEEMSWRSTTHVPRFLYDFKRFPIPPVEGTLKSIKKNWDWKTKSAKRTTSEAGLTWLAGNVKSQRDQEGLLALIKWKKTKKYEQYLQRLPDYRDSAGRIHTVLAPETDTGRLSARNPALQQIPGSDPYGVRGAFRAIPGHKLIVADYSQLELYVLAHFIWQQFKGRGLADALDSGDVHSYIAKECWPWLKKYEGNLKNSGDPKAEKARSDVKSVVYGLNYGKGDGGLGLAITDDNGKPIGKAAARDLRRSIFAGFPDIPRYQDATKAYARRHGGVRTLLGRWRPIPEALGDDHSGAGGRKALNTPIQGSAADIVTAAMLRCNTCDLPELREHGWFHSALAATGAKLVLQVHDELVYEVPSACAEEARVLIKEGMEKPFKEGFLNVPLKVDANVCDDWGAGK